VLLEATITVAAMSGVWLICKTGCRCDALWAGYCSHCWYTVCGGDRATDWDLAMAPNVYIANSKVSA
jgi:hypothetical protein